MIHDHKKISQEKLYAFTVTMLFYIHQVTLTEFHMRQ
jgi:hypothetical protein